MNVVVTIAGSDSGGGAGIQADLKTFQELGVFGTSVITALTAQNTLGVHDILVTNPEFVRAQAEAVLSDFPVRAVKTGMLASGVIIRETAEILRKRDLQLVIDPVMVAKGGAQLLGMDAVRDLRDYLIPLSSVLTPNIPEAEVLTGMTINDERQIEEAAGHLLGLGASCVVMKGGHMEDPDFATDAVYFSNGHSFKMRTKRVRTKHTHGTGCTFSAAITAFLGQGRTMDESILEAKQFIQQAIEQELGLGSGNGPTNHFAYKQRRKEDEVDIIEA
ncbi:bifunctional hydroxymethylpyrimidine kinase/phosphomethylpyrimidine kinase [Pradoshia sp.]